MAYQIFFYLFLITQYAIAEEYRILVDNPYENEGPDEEIILHHTELKSVQLEDLDMTRYLRDVLKLLRRDKPVFDKISEEFERDGYIDGWSANNLVELNPGVKGILDELKRIELQRVLTYKCDMEKKGLPKDEVKEMVKRASRHLDIYATDEFTPHDLRNIFGETNWHMEKDAEYRRDHFKYYEMHKHLELEELKKRMDANELKEIEKNIDELHRYHISKRLGRMHMPLSSDHLKEVWVDLDKMDKDQFNAKTFFHMHDLDGNKVWDEYEVKILLEKELQKMYHPGDVDYDENEKTEEMNRMIEYIEKEVDLDDDHLLEFHEVADHLARVDYGALWESIWDAPRFTLEEFDRFATRHRDEVNRMIDEKLITLPHTGVVQHLEKKAKLVK